jgi:hypothetical protein
VRWQAGNVLHPPLEGEGRFACSEAECEPGWGDLSTRADPERIDRHPTPYRILLRTIRYDPPPPGEGNLNSLRTLVIQFQAGE